MNSRVLPLNSAALNSAISGDLGIICAALNSAISQFKPLYDIKLSVFVPPFCPFYTYLSKLCDWPNLRLCTAFVRLTEYTHLYGIK
jgi:hypothetical protein